MTSLFSISLLCYLSTVTVTSAYVLADRASFADVDRRNILQGWSLQAGTCPGDSSSCGAGSCCPSALNCAPAANDEVAACCTTSSGCRGVIEGSPTCADSSWSLWKGLQGNGFCCQVGLIGSYDYHTPVAGICVTALPAGATSAVLMSTGTGAAPILTPSTSVTRSTTTSEATSTSSLPSNPTQTATKGKPVFFHYMIGTIIDAHCQQDIQNAQALGADAFALNLNTVTASWATTTVASLFKWANTYGFKLFFSFDMTGFSDPNQFLSFLQSYVTNPAYYTYNGKPFVSTFNGGASQYTFGQSSVNNGWKVALQQPMANSGHPIYFVPAFQDAPAAGFFDTYPTVDGAMNWNSWPFNNQGDIIVPTADDQTYLSGAKSHGKTFMMGVSPLQFKHMDSGDNWYRRGEQNLEYRFGQVLSLQPDFVEIQTWNDAGESHYMGNSWPEPIGGTTIGAYTNDYDHTGYWQILPAFIKAFKAGSTNTNTMYPTNGAAAQGVFWHHTLLAGGDCSADPLGKPQGANTVEDKVTVIVLVASGTANLRVDISSGSTSLGGTALVPGYNQFSVSGLTTGTVTTTVKNASGNVVLQASGPLPVVSSASLCNYNFQVVGLK